MGGSPCSKKKEQKKTTFYENNQLRMVTGLMTGYEPVKRYLNKVVYGDSRSLNTESRT